MVEKVVSGGDIRKTRSTVEKSGEIRKKVQPTHSN